MAFEILELSDFVMAQPTNDGHYDPSIFSIRILVPVDPTSTLSFPLVIPHKRKSFIIEFFIERISSNLDYLRLHPQDVI